MKRTKILAIAAIASLTLSGCAAQEGAGDGDVAESTNVTVAAQAWMIDKFNMSAMVDTFEADNPGKTVTLVEYADNQALSNFALQWSQGESSQDIVVTDGASVGVQFLARDLIVDFNTTDFFSGSTAKDRFIGETLAFTSLGDVQFSIPIGLETYNINANKTFFAEAGLLNADGTIPNPTDWNDVYDMAAALTVREGGAVTRPGMTIQWGPNAVSTMIAVQQAVSGTLYKSDGETLTFDTPEMREVFEIWKKGADEGVFSIDTFANKDAGRSNFNAGNLPMLLQSVSHVAEATPTIGLENGAVVAMPGSLENGSYGFTAGILVPTASTNQALALQFIKDAMMSDLQVGVGDQWGKLPVLTEHFDALDAPWRDTVYDLVKISVAAPMYRDLARIQVDGKQMLQEYLTGAMDLNTFVDGLEAMIDGADKNPL
ncbi:ABC transporter substrate-binding protein [Cryobacterium levicorallinum]|nr:ABC transporter substrate-binding protein [Cryobacterium levicorallinum]GEP27928.1 hypothetical protein CLE01_25260 [Cryobacterium levicorallinum]